MSDWPAVGVYNMNWCRICPHAKSKYNKGGQYDLNDPNVQKYLDGHLEDQVNLYVDETSAILYWTCKREFEMWRSERPEAKPAPIAANLSGLEDVDEFESEGDANYEHLGAIQDKLAGIKPIRVGLDQMQELTNAINVSVDIADLTKCLYPDDDEFTGDEDPNDPEGFDEDDPEPEFESFTVIDVARLLDEDVLDDVDEFVDTGVYCDYCNEMVDSVTPVDPYEPQWSRKACNSCMEVLNQGPQNDDWLKIYESLDDKDEFAPWWIRPINVTGYAYVGPRGEEAYLTYDFEDSAKVYYKTDTHAKFVLKDIDGQIRVVPDFRSSQDAPPWFDPYYNGMIYASVAEKDGRGVWIKGAIPPFTSEQNREWSQVMGQPPVMESVLTEGIDPVLLVQVLNHRGIKPSPEYIHPPPEPETNLLPQSGTDLDDTDEFESMESPCDEGMPYGGWDVVLHDRQGNGVTEELFGEYNLNIFTAEHPLGFDTGGCLVWLEIQDDWTGDRPFPTVYYWRGKWRTEDEPGGRWQAENKTSVKSIAEDLDDKDEFGEPPFIQIVITDPKLSAKEAIARTIDVLKNPRGFNSYRDQNGWSVTGVEVTAYSPSDSVNTPDAWNLPSYEELANIPGALTEVEGYLQHNEPLLANPDLAFTDHFNGPGIQISTYVGY